MGKTSQLHEKEIKLEVYNIKVFNYVFLCLLQLKPMRMFFQLLEIQTVTVKNASHVTVAESPPSTSIEVVSLPSTNPNTGTNNEKTGPSCSAVLGKKRLRDNSSLESVSKPKKLRSDDRDTRGVQMGKMRNNQRIPSGSQTPRRTVQPQDDIDEVVDSRINSPIEFNRIGKDLTKEYSPEPRNVLTESAKVMEVDTVSQTPHSVEDEDEDIVAREASQDIEEVVVDIEGESSQEEHFILQEEQQIDISEDLEEDDDEDRLRICDPEEVIEDRNGADSFDETVVAEAAQNSKRQLETLIEEEEEVEVVRKESKSRKKNKKAKHHHRHKRDYSPAPEATIVSDDKNDIMKLKVKITRPDSDANGAARNKQEESAKHVKHNDSQKQSKHKTIVISDDNDNNSVQSLNTNMDEDSRHSQSTDDHDARSITSSKEGQEEGLSHTKETTPNRNLKQLKAKNVQDSNKAKLLQMRQVRHKNITPPPRNTSSTTITKVTSEEASRNSPIVLSSPNSSLTVSKVTAEERLKMMTNNNLESTQPSLEIIPVNKSNMLPKTIENKTPENNYTPKGLPNVSPVVRLIKTNYLGPNKQQSLSATKVNNNNESLKNSKEDKSKTRPGERRPESFGVLDLSKPARSASSSPASEGSCPSPNQTTLSLTQPIINRHVNSINSPHRASSDSPPVQGPMPKGSPNRSMQYPHSMYNLSVLSNAAVHIENKTQLAQEAMKRQLNNQKVQAPLQRYPGMSPTKTPVPRASPTQLKIPNPNVSLHSKFINRPKLPSSTSMSLQNSVRPTRPLPPANVRPNNNFGGNMLSQSAAVAKKQAGINGRPNIPPPPAGIPISELYKMPQKYDLEKIARKLTAGRNAEVKGQARIPSS